MMRSRICCLLSASNGFVRASGSSMQTGGFGLFDSQGAPVSSGTDVRNQVTLDRAPAANLRDAPGSAELS